MKRRFTRFLSQSALGLSLVAAPAWGQETPENPKSETPRTENPAPAPVAVMPVTEAYVPLAAPRPNIAVGVEYLQWWYKRDVIPSLLNSAKETDSLFAGTENDPTARSLIGTSQYAYRTVPGVRANVAIAIVDNCDLEFNGFLMQSQSVNQTFSGTNGQPFLTRPFFNQHDLVEGGFDTSTKDGVSGSLSVHAQNRFYGGEANISWFPVSENCYFNKLMVGFRQVSLHETLAVTENITANGPGFLAFFPVRTDDNPNGNGTLRATNFDPATQAIRIVDGFVTRNEFYGPQAGAQWRWGSGPFSFDLLTKVALGVNHETINVQGATSLLTKAGAVLQTGPGGLLAVATNSGNHSADELTVVPEIGVKFNFDMTQCLRFNIGYNLLYMSSVARPGNQIDRRINPQFVPSDIAYFPQTTGPFYPRGFFRDTDFYAHGLAFGVEVRY
jgi:Putative beta barrel porin-7 (BBP7)